MNSANLKWMLRCHFFEESFTWQDFEVSSQSAKVYSRGFYSTLSTGPRPSWSRPPPVWWTLPLSKACAPVGRMFWWRMSLRWTWCCLGSLPRRGEGGQPGERQPDTNVCLSKLKRMFLAELNADHCDQLPGNMMRAQWWPTLLAALPTGSDSMCEGLRGGQGGRWPQSWQYLHPAHRQSPSGNTWKCGMRPRTVHNNTHSVVSHSLMLNQVLVIR